MSQELSIQELLERGLYQYGLGEIKRALEFWHEVLKRDPTNEAAREYIEIETGRKVEAGLEEAEILELEEEVTEETLDSAPLPSMFMEGLQYLQISEWEKAGQAFESTHRTDPSNPLSWAYVALSRARLIKETIDRIGGQEEVPRLKVPLTKLIGQKDFTQEEGFVLSLISGEITLEDIIALSPIPRFQTYHLLYRLVLEGLLETEGGEVR